MSNTETEKDIERWLAEMAILDKERKKLQPKVQPEKQTTEEEFYSCDVCQTAKIAETSAKPFHIRISIRPEKISTVCPDCRKHVVMIDDKEEGWRNW